MKTPVKLAFWVTNISPRNVTLADLALNIRAFSTVNLLDKKHYKYTMEQLLKSKETGSIFKKSDKIKVRPLPPPDAIKTSLPIQRDTVMPSRERSLLVINEKEYPELKFADEIDEKEAQKKIDEDLARDNAELDEAPQIKSS
jgi:hypothetical protein